VWDWIKRGAGAVGFVQGIRGIKQCYEKAKTCDEYAEEMCNSTYPEVFGNMGFGPIDVNFSNRLLCKHEVRKCCLKQAAAGGANVLIPLFDPFTVPECKP